MIAFHLIISAYGFWLPNDPRGSWSDFVSSWELYRFGPATKVSEHRSFAHDPHDRQKRLAAKRALKYPAVRFEDAQRLAIAHGFAQACEEGEYRCFACCIGHDHAHLVLSCHPRPITMIIGHLKASATRALTEKNLHPLARFTGKRGGAPTPWSEGGWRVFIDSKPQLASAISYVERHSPKEGLPEQRWDFVQQTNSR